jgi:hypothetical protein
MLRTENQAMDQYEKEIVSLKVSGWGKIHTLLMPILEETDRAK